MNSVLPTIDMYVCRRRYVALVDSGCSQIIVSRKMCQIWKKKNVEVMPLNGEMCISGVKQIDPRVDGGTAEIEAFVAQEDPHCVCNQGPDFFPFQNQEWCTFSASNLLHAQ